MAQDGASGSSEHNIQAVHTMFTVVDGLREFDSVGVSELASTLELPKSTTFVYLKTLEEAGYVVNDGGEYRLGLRFLELGGSIRQRLRLFQAAKQEIDELSSQVGEVANLGVMEDGQRVLLYTSQPSDGMFDNAPTGEFTNMHWTALGKALLSQLSDERVDAVVDQHGLPSATDATITERDALFDELEAIRERGYAIEDQERREGVKAVAIPVRYSDDPDPVAAAAISGPKRRLGDDSLDDGILEGLREAVNIIELSYKHY
ncbi:IclR family transcriptional regulator [Halomicroarcula sp. GCM10025817]|uniref:IclR family transcriptional regulator n=1 Tax=Haloarcula TaxID=2237 RepID=UPI0023E77D75|nr:IclR family transcriptional regulator [Halomicroarcula sp. SYNS111]